MANTSPTGQRPASQKDATSSAKPVLKLRDGSLNLTVFSKETVSRGKAREHSFVVLERSFQRDDAWQSTNLLHVEDLLAAAEMLRLAYLKVRDPVQPVKGSE